MSVFLLIVGLVLFVGLVVVHEFGHFIMARRNGVEVEEFGIGFPPRAWSRQTKKGFLFSINWLPIGGFVKLKGEADAADEPGSLGMASTWAKSKIMLAGVVMNLVVAFVLFTILGWAGTPQILDNQFHVASDTKYVRHQVTWVDDNSPAAKAGLQEHDRLTSIENGQHSINLHDEPLMNATKSFAGQTVVVHFERAGKPQTTQLTMLSEAQVEASKHTDHPLGYLGVSEFATTRATWSAPVAAIGMIGQFTVETFHGLGVALAALFHGNGSQAAQQVSGPVGIVVLLQEGSKMGYQFVLFIIAIISLTLTLMNILPIPALDGGRLYMMWLSRAFGKKLSKSVEEWIVGASFVALLGLIVVITVVDVRRFF